MIEYCDYAIFVLLIGFIGFFIIYNSIIKSFNQRIIDLEKRCTYLEQTDLNYNFLDDSLINGFHTEDWE